MGVGNHSRVLLPLPIVGKKTKALCRLNGRDHRLCREQAQGQNNPGWRRMYAHGAAK